MTKLEQVARAIAGPVWETCSDRMREQFWHQARAAIASLKDPSPEQIRALSDFSDRYLERYGNYPDVSESYEVLLDAALWGEPK